MSKGKQLAFFKSCQINQFRVDIQRAYYACFPRMGEAIPLKMTEHSHMMRIGQVAASYTNYH